MIARQTEDPPVVNRQGESTDPTAPPPGVRPDISVGRGFWLLIFLSMAVVGGFAYLQFRRVDDARTQRGIVGASERHLPVIGPVPDFTLTDRTGRTVKLADLKGKIWVADFIFTTCGGPCPMMTQRMGELRRALYSRGVTDVVCITFTVDPETDTPSVLTDYARQFNAESPDWLFLTGDVLSIYDLSRDGFKLPAGPGEGEAHKVEHSPRFVLVDHEARIRGYYEIVTDEEMERPREEVFGKPMPPGSRDKLLADIQWLRREVRR